jgi:NADH-quinone oxidoreductase subunit N
MATGTKAAAFGFLIANLGPLLPHGAAPVVVAIALVTMLVGNLGALVQEDLKRMLAYSSVAHAGTLLLLLAAGMHDPELTGALRAALYYLGGYLFTAMGAFGLLAWLESEDPRNTRLEALRGLGQRRPAVGGLLALFLLSLGGIPATAGFLGKWFVFSVLVQADMIGAAIVGALLSVIALGYYLRVIVALFMQRPEQEPAPGSARLLPTIATVACGAFVLVLGLLPAPFLRLLGP